MNLLIFLIWTSFLGCQTVSADLAEAKRLQEEGQLSQAFDLYVKLEKEYPGTSISKQSSLGLQKIYRNYAEEQEEVDPEKAVQLYQKMLERWPNDSIAVLVEKRIAKLKNATPQLNEAQEKKSVAVNPSMSDEEKLFCDKAKASASRIVWQQYKQQYPDGSCVEEADDFLQGAQPRDSELDQMRSLVRQCQSALKGACQEYNLSKTTSDEAACQHSSRSFSNELQRLIRRKRILLADGNQDYYQKFIPKRWNSVKSGIDTACQATKDFLAEKEELGVDLTSFQEIVNDQCGICLEEFGDIESL